MPAVVAVEHAHGCGRGDKPVFVRNDVGQDSAAGEHENDDNYFEDAESQYQKYRAYQNSQRQKVQRQTV